MKNLLLLLISCITFGQTTLYKSGFPRDTEYSVPLTYHDYTEVGPAIQLFAINKLGMSLDENDFEVKKGDSILYMKFTENGIGKKFEKMRVNMHLVSVGNDAVFSKVEITGGFDVVTKFWAYFWHTTPRFKFDGKTGLLAENSFIHDKIQLTRTPTGARILVTNTGYTPETFRKFLKDYEAKKQSEKAEQKPVEIVEKPKPIERKPQPKQSFKNFDIQVTKDKKGFAFSKEIPIELQEQIKQDLQKEENGKYTVLYDVFFLDDKVSKMNLKLKKKDQNGGSTFKSLLNNAVNVYR